MQDRCSGTDGSTPIRDRPEVVFGHDKPAGEVLTLFGRARTTSERATEFQEHLDIGSRAGASILKRQRGDYQTNCPDALQPRDTNKDLCRRLFIWAGGSTPATSDSIWRPVAYASRSLTETERRYAQIEKEALATTWSCEKFHDYVLGKQFEIEMDHKPLVPLLSNKRLDDPPEC